MRKFTFVFNWYLFGPRLHGWFGGKKILPPANEICEGYVFTPVCQSFCSRGGVSASVHAGIHTPRSRHPWEQTPRKADTPLLRSACSEIRWAVRILLECILVFLQKLQTLCHDINNTYRKSVITSEFLLEDNLRHALITLVAFVQPVGV